MNHLLKTCLNKGGKQATAANINSQIKPLNDTSKLK